MLVVAGVAVLVRLGPGIWESVTGQGPERDAEGIVIESGTASAFDIRVGDCFTIADGAQATVEEADLAPCSEPHMFEAYAEFVYPDKARADYPGTASIFELSDVFCMQEFEAFVGHAWETSALDFAYLYPEEEGWELGDRTVLCLIEPVSGEPLVGTARGASY